MGLGSTRQSLGGQNQAEIQVGLRCPHQRPPWVKGKSLLRALPAGASGGRRTEWGREAAWGLLRGLNQWGFGEGSEPNLNKNKDMDMET